MFGKPSPATPPVAPPPATAEPSERTVKPDPIEFPWRDHEKGPTAEKLSSAPSPFFRKVVCFTGRLKTLKRDEAIQKIEDRGGYASAKPVNDDTDLLVCADRKKTTSKLRRALDMNARGHRIKIITEGQFRSLLDGRD